MTNEKKHFIWLIILYKSILARTVFNKYFGKRRR